MGRAPSEDHVAAPTTDSTHTVMVQALGKQKDVTVDSITATVDDRIVAKWKRRGVCPWAAGDQFSDLGSQDVWVSGPMLVGGNIMATFRRDYMTG